VPAKLRIDVGDPARNNTYLMVNGTLTIVQDGKETGTRPLVNMLLVLGFDVYRQSPETTAKVVTGEGYDLTKLHEDTWEGKPAYVVGAEKGNLNAKQFWVDKERMLFLRVIEPTQQDASKFQDIRFVDYHKYGEAWLAEQVEVYADGKKVFSEEYSDIHVNAKLAAGTFDAAQVAATHWEKQ